MAAESSAIISGVTLRGCIKPGGSMLVRGRGFGGPGYAQLVASDGKSYIPLETFDWTGTHINATLPVNGGFVSGRSYTLGLRNYSKRWISNRDKTFIVCKQIVTAPAGLESSTVLKSVGRDVMSSTSGSNEDSEKSYPVGTESGPAATSSDTVSNEMSSEIYEESSSSGPLTVMPEIGGSGATFSIGSIEKPQAGQPGGTEDREPGELLAAHATMDEAREYDAIIQGRLGRLIRRRTLKSLGIVLSTYRFETDAILIESLQILQSDFNGIAIDFNSHFFLQADVSASQAARARSLGWKQEFTACSSDLRIGMLDTGIYIKHAALLGRSITARNFLPSGVELAGQDHGTAIATLLVGAHGGDQYAGLLPDARLLAGSVFRKSGKKSYTNAELLLAGLDWLSGEQVSIINLSLGGPYNRLVEIGILRVIGLNIAVVAAAGSGDWSKQPLFPAYLSGVVAVNAVDADNKPARRSPSGSFISFAAPGVDVWAGTAGGNGRYYSGSSFATPYVVAAMALAGQGAYQKLAESARDLGEPGRDEVFGWGLVRFNDLICP